MAVTKEHKKQAIIAEAAKLFKKYGFEKTSLNDIANAMGKSRTSVYTYFKNKEELFIAQVENETQPFFVSLKNILNIKSAAVEKIKIYNSVKFAFIKANQKDYMQMNKEIIRNPALKASLSKLTADKETKIMYDILMSGIKSGEFKNLTPKEAKLIASIFFTAMSAVVGDLYVKNDMKNFVPATRILENMLVQFLKK